jgi:DNA primase
MYSWIGNSVIVDTMTKDKIETIRQGLLCSDIVPEFGTAKNHKINCICPDHDDKEASMQWYTDTNKVYCFGCPWRGSVFDLIGLVHGISDFREQLRIAAQKLGMDIDDISEAQTEQYQYLKEQRRIRTEVAEYCHKKLYSEQGNAPKARKYLESRGYTEETIKYFKVGLINVAALLKSKKFSKEELETAGLYKSNKPLYSTTCIFFPFYRGLEVWMFQMDPLREEK